VPRRRAMLEEGGMMEKESGQDRVRAGVRGQMAVVARVVNLGTEAVPSRWPREHRPKAG
jgi:hypothetical protein